MTETITDAPESAANSQAWARSSVRSRASAPAFTGSRRQRGQMPAPPMPLLVSAAACSIWPLAWVYAVSMVAGSFWWL